MQNVIFHGSMTIVAQISTIVICCYFARFGATNGKCKTRSPAEELRENPHTHTHSSILVLCSQFPQTENAIGNENKGQELAKGNTQHKHMALVCSVFAMFGSLENPIIDTSIKIIRSLFIVQFINRFTNNQQLITSDEMKLPKIAVQSECYFIFDNLTHLIPIRNGFIDPTRHTYMSTRAKRRAAWRTLTI